MFKGVNHVAVFVKSREESIAFYRDVLEARLLFTVDNESDGLLIAMMELGTMQIELLEPPVGKEEVIRAAEQTFNHFAVDVDDIEAAVVYIRAKGYSVEEPGIYDVPAFGRADRHLQVAFFHGPNGERIELFKELGSECTGSTEK